MAQDVKIFNVVVAPGDSATAPHYYPMELGSREVVGVEFVIPNGNRGAAQFALAMAKTIIVPSNAGAYLTGDDETIKWDLQGYPNAGSWQLAAFNSGGFPHTIQVRFLCNIPQRSQTVNVNPAILVNSAGITSGISF